MSLYIYHSCVQKVCVTNLRKKSIISLMHLVFIIITSPPPAYIVSVFCLSQLSCKTQNYPISRKTCTHKRSSNDSIKINIGTPNSLNIGTSSMKQSKRYQPSKVIFDSELMMPAQQVTYILLRSLCLILSGEKIIFDLSQ